MTLPMLGLAFGRRPPPAVVPLLAAACRWCRPRTIDPAAGRPDAILAPISFAERMRGSLPVALWATTAEEADSPIEQRAAAIVSDDLQIVDRAGTRGVLAAVERHAEHRQMMPPFVRERLRRARGLPAVCLLEQASDGLRWAGRPEPLGPDIVATAIACASAVAVRDWRLLLEALAWGAPCVTDAASAERVGAIPGTHVLVAEREPDHRTLATSLATDQELAARLSWAGRQLVERRHDAGRAAIRLVELLGLREHQATGAMFELSRLGTPSSSTIRSTFGDAIRSMPFDARREPCHCLRK